MKTIQHPRSSSASAGLAAAIFCSGVWLGLGMFILALQGGGVA